MPWVKIDDGFPYHAKVSALSNSAFRLHVTGMCHAAKNLTDGFISPKNLSLLGWASESLRTDVEELMSQGLWEKADGGYMIHDFLEYNPSKEQVEQLRQQRIEAGQRGGLAKAKASANQVLDQNDSKIVPPSPSPPPLPTPIPDPEDQDGAKAPATDKEPPKKRKPSKKDQIRGELEQHFSDVTKIPLPTGTKEANGKLWWTPLREIAKLCEWDVGAGRQLIDLAVRDMIADGLTMSSPKSILSKATSVHAAMKRGDYGHNAAKRGTADTGGRGRDTPDPEMEARYRASFEAAAARKAEGAGR